MNNSGYYFCFSCCDYVIYYDYLSIIIIYYQCNKDSALWLLFSLLIVLTKNWIYHQITDYILLMIWCIDYLYIIDDLLFLCWFGGFSFSAIYRNTYLQTRAQTKLLTMQASTRSLHKHSTHREFVDCYSTCCLISYNQHFHLLSVHGIACLLWYWNLQVSVD